jgi:hypothetical protein
MQLIIFRYEGMIRQFRVDDKGIVLIAAFGLQPFADKGLLLHRQPKRRET